MRFWFVLGEIVHGLRRNASMVTSVILVTFVSFLFVGSAALLQTQITKLKGDWYDKASVSVFLCPANSKAATCAGGEADSAQVAAVRDLIDTQLADEIQTVYLVTKEDAFADFQHRFPDGYLGTQLTANDMQASFRLKLTNPTHYDVVVDVLTGRPGVEFVEDQRTIFGPVFLALDRASLLAAGLAVVMLGAGVMLIVTTIRLSALSRRRETGIMRLVGASNWFIQLPFILEGAIAAVVGAALAVLGLWAGVKYLITDWLQNSVKWLAYVDVGDVARIAPMLMIAAFALAVAASAVSLRRHTRV